MKRADNSPYQWLSILCVANRSKENKNTLMGFFFFLQWHHIKYNQSILSQKLLPCTKPVTCLPVELPWEKSHFHPIVKAIGIATTSQFLRLILLCL